MISLLIVNLCLTFLFFSTSITKIKNLEDHKKIFKEYMAPLRLNDKFTNVLVFSGVFFEIITGILISSWVYSKIGYYLAIFLLISYSILVGINLLKGNIINCGCGGVLGNKKITKVLIFRNLLLASLVYMVDIYTNIFLIDSLSSLLYMFLFLPTIIMTFLVIEELSKIENWDKMQKRGA